MICFSSYHLPLGSADHCSVVDIGQLPDITMDSKSQSANVLGHSTYNPKSISYSLYVGNGASVDRGLVLDAVLVRPPLRQKILHLKALTIKNSSDLIAPLEVYATVCTVLYNA